MLKKTIKYTDMFDGSPQEAVVFFNLTKTELKELQFSAPGGFGSIITEAIESQDGTKLFAEFKNLIRISYGVRDGDRFVKNDENWLAFTQTAAYDAFFTEISENQGAMLEFLKNVLPDDVVAEINVDAIPEEVEKMVQQTPPPPPPGIPQGGPHG